MIVFIYYKSYKCLVPLAYALLFIAVVLYTDFCYTVKLVRVAYIPDWGPRTMDERIFRYIYDLWNHVFFAPIIFKVNCTGANPNGCAVLRRRSAAICWDVGFKSHGCLSHVCCVGSGLSNGVITHSEESSSVRVSNCA